MDWLFASSLILEAKIGLLMREDQENETKGGNVATNRLLVKFTRKHHRIHKPLLLSLQIK